MEAWSLVRDPSYIRTDKLDARNSDSRLSTFSNALNESNPKTVAWLVTWKLISIGNPLPLLEIPFETFDQLSRPTSPPRLGSPIDHRSPLPKYRSSTRQPCQFSKRRPSPITISLPRRNRTDSIVQLLIWAALQKEALRAIHLTRSFRSLIYPSCYSSVRINNRTQRKFLSRPISIGTI